MIDRSTYDLLLHLPRSTTHSVAITGTRDLGPIPTSGSSRPADRHCQPIRSKWANSARKSAILTVFIIRAVIAATPAPLSIDDSVDSWSPHRQMRQVSLELYEWLVLSLATRPGMRGRSLSAGLGHPHLVRVFEGTAWGCQHNAEDGPAPSPLEEQSERRATVDGVGQEPARLLRIEPDIATRRPDRHG